MKKDEAIVDETRRWFYCCLYKWIKSMEKDVTNKGEGK